MEIKKGNKKGNKKIDKCLEKYHNHNHIHLGVVGFTTEFEIRMNIPANPP